MRSGWYELSAYGNIFENGQQTKWNIFARIQKKKKLFFSERTLQIIRYSNDMVCTRQFSSLQFEYDELYRFSHTSAQNIHEQEYTITVKRVDTSDGK